MFCDLDQRGYDDPFDGEDDEEEPEEDEDSAVPGRSIRGDDEDEDDEDEEETAVAPEAGRIAKGTTVVSGRRFRPYSKRAVVPKKVRF